MDKLITQEKALELLDVLYKKTLDGVPKVSKSVTEMADEYLNKYVDPELAANKMLSAQIKKCTTSGFLSGLVGIVNLPVAVGSDISLAWYVQLRMIAGVAYIGGYNLDDDEVQTLIYACLAGVSVTNLAKKAGIDIGQKAAKNLINKIPGELLVKINQRVGFRAVTKFGEKGAINLVDLVPGVGAVVSGGFDYAETKVISKRAYKAFIKGDLNALGDTKKIWYKIEEDVASIEEIANELSLEFYYPEKGILYINCTKDNIDDMNDAIGKKIDLKKLTAGEARANKRYTESSLYKNGRRNITEVEYEVEEDDL